VSYLRRERGARPRSDRRERPQPSDPLRLPAQSRHDRLDRAGGASASQGAGQHPPPARAFMSWILVRVDDRLIHGQVVIAWGGRMHPARIWVADDAIAASDWERELLV